MWWLDLCGNLAKLRFLRGRRNSASSPRCQLSEFLACEPAIHISTCLAHYWVSQLLEINLNLSLCFSLSPYICVCMCICIYIYIHIYNLLLFLFLWRILWRHVSILFSLWIWCNLAYVPISFLITEWIFLHLTQIYLHNSLFTLL